MIELIDKFTTSFPLLLVTMLEAIAISWVYGQSGQLLQLNSLFKFFSTSGKGTTDAIFIVRQMQEKCLAKKKELWMTFVDLEKAVD